MSQSSRPVSRRRFLVALGTTSAASAAAAASAAIPASPTATPPAVPDDKRDGQGYAETAHVQTYYRTARL